jgi:drug/metabolite transporter (DMT)-like permease
VLETSAGDDGLRLRSWLLFALVVLLWGSNWATMKMGLGFVTPVAFVLQRFAVAVLVVFPVFLLLRNRMPKDRTTLVGLVVLCLIFVSLVLAQAVGLSHESSGIGAVLTYTQPLFVFLLAVPFLKEKVTVIKLLGAGVGFVGVVVLSYSGIGSFTFDSVLMMLLGAFLWAVAVVYYKKYLSHVDALITHFLQLAVGVLPLLLLNSTINGFTLPMDPVFAGILLYSSIGALAVGNIVWLYLLRQEEATTLSASTLIIPAVALIFGWQLLGESLTVESLVGALLTLAGVCLVNIRAVSRINGKVSSFLKKAEVAAAA